MKKTYWLLAIISLLTIPAQAQDQSAPATIGGVGEHHRVWQRVTTQTDRNGKSITVTNAAYTELETGMNVRQPDGSYLEASDEIESFKTGAIAQKTRHRVIFSANCNSPVAVDMETADGKRLQSRILGLSFFDESTGQSVLIAELKDSEGQLLTDTKNEVLYVDAFTDLKADILYKNSKAGIEQDIILRENPPSPAEYKLNPATTKLEVLTEFIDPPTPQKREVSRQGVVDEHLDFGDLQMGNGRVYVLDKEAVAIPVTKQWNTMAGRTFLIEQIPYTIVEPELKALPGRTASINTSPNGVIHQVSAKRLLPAIKQAKKSTGAMKMAKVSLGSKGVVLDYIAASSATNFTFGASTNYYVSGLVSLSGTTTIEGGTVVKVTNSTAAKIDITGTINCQTLPYRPAAFTSKDDNSIGETLPGSTGTPTNYYGNGLVVNTTGNILHDLRISYAASAITLGFTAGQINITNSQFIKCQYPIDSTGKDDNTVVIDNGLFYSSFYVIRGGDFLIVKGRHLTVNQCNKVGFNSGFGTQLGDLYLTNSLVVAATNGWGFTGIGNSLTTNSTAYFTTDPGGIFQTVGSGSHYLADNSPYRNAGTTNIAATLLAELRKKTTYPPILRSNVYVSVDTTLMPQAGRDTDTPDLGYHYNAIDYIACYYTFTNCTLTIGGGAVVGYYDQAGIRLSAGASIRCEGTPTAMNKFVHHQTVQELPNAFSFGYYAGSGFPVNTYRAGGSAGTGYFRFTEFAHTLAGTFGPYQVSSWTGWAYSQLTVRDCFFGRGLFSLEPYAGSQFVIENNVVENPLGSADFGFAAYDINGISGTMVIRNNLIKGGTLTFADWSLTGLAQFEFTDNVVDKAIVDLEDVVVTNHHNAYVIGYTRLTPTNANDVVLTNSPIYQTSYLGNYYYPTNGGLLSLLINAGSRNSTNAGLYHFTTTTNQVKEASSTVDIGFHYVATDTTGVPLATDGDDLADYVEDVNGNGVYDYGDIGNFNNSDTDGDGVIDQVFQVRIVRPSPASSIP